MNPNQEAGNVWWLNLFLAESFFLVCGAHINNQENHQNHYCIDCKMVACQHCLSEGTHSDHRVITIYRYTLKDVVALDEMSTHIDSSSIQPYTFNGRLTLALHPLPQSTSAQLEPNVCCRTCSERFAVPRHYHYCSIACKFQMENAKMKTNKPAVKPPAPDHGTEGNAEASADRGRKRPRGASRSKGVPIRSPLF